MIVPRQDFHVVLQEGWRSFAKIYGHVAHRPPEANNEFSQILADAESANPRIVPSADV